MWICTIHGGLVIEECGLIAAAIIHGAIKDIGFINPLPGEKPGFLIKITSLPDIILHTITGFNNFMKPVIKQTFIEK